MIKNDKTMAIGESSASTQLIDDGMWVEAEAISDSQANKPFKYAVITANLLLYMAVMTFSFIPNARTLLATVLG